MAKQVLSARVEADLAGWAKVVAKRRDVTLASVVEEALAAYRLRVEGAHEGRLPIEELEDRRQVVPLPRPSRSEWERTMAARQDRLNKGKG